MELRKVDPRLLHEDPLNPRKSAAMPAYEEQMLANIKAIGLIQPPLFKERDGEFFIVAGTRRVRACVKAGLLEIDALFTTEDNHTDSMRALAENIIRTGLGTVDTWRAIEALIGAEWTEDAIATALHLPPRTVRRLRLCGNIHNAVLDHMAKGDEPNENQLKTIASAQRADQAEAWKKHKPKKGEGVSWWDYARALEKRRMYARDASFDDAVATAHGIAWVEDLFDQGEQDNRYTTQVEDFLGAQHEWMGNNLPKRGIILTLNADGHAKLPAKAERNWGEPRKTDYIGYYVDERTGKVDTIGYRMPAEKMSGKAPPAIEDSDPAGEVLPARKRPPVTKDGLKMIGDFRTDALHQAFDQDPIDDLTLIGLLVLNFCGNNVDVRTGISDETLRVRGREILVGRITPDGLLTKDPETLRNAARAALRIGLGLRETGYQANSGMVARVAGVAVDADRYLPGMATEEFLSCVSKAEIEAIGSANAVLPCQTGKATRAAVIARFKNATFVYEGAKFDLTAAEVAIHAVGSVAAVFFDGEDNVENPDGIESGGTNTGDLEPSADVEGDDQPGEAGDLDA